MTYTNVVNKWKTLLHLKPSERKNKFSKWIISKGFTTNASLEGSYKTVYIHQDLNFVIKLSKKGTGNALPNNKKIKDLILQPLYSDKYLLIQRKVDCSSSASESAFLSLQWKIKDRKLTQFFSTRDFSQNNCGMLEDKPYIFDISYFPGYTTN
jgi:hypothetical protein